MGGALLWFVIARIPLGDALAVASTIDLQTGATVAALYFLAHAVNAAKLQVFLPHLPLWQALRFTLIALLYGTALPGQITGDAVKALRLARAQADGEAGAAVAAVAVDKIVGVFALLLFTALGLGLEADVFGRAAAAGAALAVAGAGAVLAAALVLPVPARFGRSVAAWRAASFRPASLVHGLLLGLIFQALCVAIFLILGAALNIVLSFAAWAVVVGLVSLVLLAPVTVAGLGLREATLVSVIGVLGGSEVAAFALSLVLFVLTLAGAAAGLAADLMGRDRA